MGGTDLNDEKNNYGRIRVCFCNNLHFVLYGGNLSYYGLGWTEWNYTMEI